MAGNTEYKTNWAREWRKKNPDKIKEYNQKRREQRLLLGDEYYEKNKEFRKQQSKDYYERNKDKVSKRNRIRHLKLTYNLDAQQYLDMINKQNNCCAICNKPEHRILKTGDIKPLSVDHNHTTGEVRALLCNDCNALLGFAKENIGVLQNAITYISKYS